MKKILIILAILLPCFMYAQTVNDVPLKDIDVEYVRIVGSAKLLSTKVTIQIDFGQHDKLFKSKDTQIRDENGKLLTLNSMVDALNFMSKYGYEFEDAYAISVGGTNVYHYLMRKKKA